MVLARPYRVEAELFGQDRLFEEVAVDLVHRLRAARQLANSHADDEFHAASPIAPIRVRHGSPMSPPQRTEQAGTRRVRPVRLRFKTGRRSVLNVRAAVWRGVVRDRGDRGTLGSGMAALGGSAPFRNM